jgi:peroxiredoxin family protein
MSRVLICREAIEDSVLGNLALARAFVQSGGEACVVFTGEALRALDTGTFEWSRNFKTREVQAAVVGAAEQAGLPLAHHELDGRWSDVRAFVRSVQAESGVRLIACPIFAALLDLGPGVDHLERITESELVDLLQSADTVMGGY